jgi:hypothetical protein
VIDVPHERSSIVDAIRTQLAGGRLPSDTLYGDGRAGERMAVLLAEVPLSIEKRLTYQTLPADVGSVQRREAA